MKAYPLATYATINGVYTNMCIATAINGYKSIRSRGVPTGTARDRIVPTAWKRLVSSPTATCWCVKLARINCALLAILADEF